MSKIAEIKSFDRYPKDRKGCLYDMARNEYIKGYDQAMQDFLEKAEKWIEKHIEMFSWIHCDSDCNEEWRNDFKNYMQNEM